MKYKKKHAPIAQLKQAAKEAQRILVERGIHTKESSIDRILNEKKIVLPGIPAYLPHRWTLQASRRIMLDIITMWISKTKGNHKKQENIGQFFSFIGKEMKSMEKSIKRDVNAMPAILKALKGNVLLSKIFEPQQKLETVQTMWQFIFDSMAVAVVVKCHHNTSDFANWFLDWSHELENYWKPNQEKNDK